MRLSFLPLGINDCQQAIVDFSRLFSNPRYPAKTTTSLKAGLKQTHETFESGLYLSRQQTILMHPSVVHSIYVGTKKSLATTYSPTVKAVPSA